VARFMGGRLYEKGRSDSDEMVVNQGRVDSRGCRDKGIKKRGEEKEHKNI